MEPRNNIDDRLIRALESRPEVQLEMDLAEKVIRKIEAKEAREALRSTRMMWVVNAVFILVSAIALLFFVDSEVLKSFAGYLPWIAVAVLTIGGWSLVEKQLNAQRKHAVH